MVLIGVLKNSWFFLFIGILLINSACERKETKTENINEVDTEKTIKTPVFNPDSAFSFIERQIAFGPRVPNTSAHIACGQYLANTLAGCGAELTAQTFVVNAFDGTPLKTTNIIASFNPEKTKRVMLAAHWDTRPFADKDHFNKDQPIIGANDGASGVAILLEIARLLKNTAVQPNVGIDIILFDGEDYGNPAGGTANDYCLGSQYWAKNKHSLQYRAYYGILLDMVGASNAKFYKEEVSMRYAPGILDKVWSQASKSGYANYFINKNAPGITDDHYYVNEIAKIPMIDIIDLDGNGNFPYYHHTHSDNIDIISRETLKAVGQTVVDVIYSEK